MSNIGERNWQLCPSARINGMSLVLKKIQELGLDTVAANKVIISARTKDGVVGRLIRAPKQLCTIWVGLEEIA